MRSHFRVSRVLINLLLLNFAMACGSGGDGVKATRIKLVAVEGEGADLAFLLGSGTNFKGKLGIYDEDTLVGQMPVVVKPWSLGASAEVVFNTTDETIAFGNFANKHLKNLLGEYVGFQMGMTVGAGFKGASMFNMKGVGMSLGYATDSGAGANIGIPWVIVEKDGEGDFPWNQELED
jgi:hypothetical protein